MDQKAFFAVTAMLNSFPQGGGNPDVTMRTYEEALRDVTSQAIIEAAQRFTCGDVCSQSKTFAPSIAEFVQEARRIAQLLPYRGKQALPPPTTDCTFLRDDKPTRIRMGFKMSVLSASNDIKDGADMVAEAEKSGLEHMIELGRRWGVPVPEDLLPQQKTAT